MDRTVLPIRAPEPPHSSVVDVRDLAESYPLRQRPAAPVGAPNVLVVLVDDMGFGASSAYGGPCRMSTAERLARDGLRYTRFHTTAICAPTRVSLLSGRNHHSAGMGTVPELSTSAPGYNCVRPDTMATLPRILSANGYHTGAFGKMHQTPMWEVGETGPFDRWPLNDGFDRFYGFLGAETNQFSPALVDGFTPIEPPRTPEEGYHLSEDIVDRAQSWVRNVSSLEPDRPWFAYVSFGACHDPIHVPEEWRDRFRGEFANGWNRQREETLARQRELGVVPPDAVLPDFDPDVPDWDSLGEDSRTVCERLMELYAAFAEHMDAQVGRLVDTLEELGQLDNTLVLYILGDNGAAAEGGLWGTHNLACNLNRVRFGVDDILAQLDELGGPNTFPHYPVGWALSMNTPYQQSKKYASHYGGTRNGMIVHWPERIREAGMRHQWHHCIDVTPTVLEAAGLPQPQIVDGVAQAPIEGTSFAYTFEDPDAADRHTRQYFEIHGSRGIYSDGWTAVARHHDMHWSRSYRPPSPFSEDVWELYDTRTDWTQARDVAAEFPDRLAQLQQEFLVEAARHQVLPLDDRMHERFDPATAPRPDLMGARRSITLHPDMRGLREGAAPDVKNTSFSVTAQVEVPDEGGSAGDGVLIAQGGRFAGWSLHVHEGRLVYCHNHCGRRTHVRAAEPLAPGAHALTLRFDYDGGGIGKGGEVSLLVDGEQVADGRLEATVGYQFSMDETLDVGCDRGTPVSEEYGAQPALNRYRGRLAEVRIVLGDDGEDPGPEERARVLMATH